MACLDRCASCRRATSRRWSPSRLDFVHQQVPTVVERPVPERDPARLVAHREKGAVGAEGEGADPLALVEAVLRLDGEDPGVRICRDHVAVREPSRAGEAVGRRLSLRSPRDGKSVPPGPGLRASRAYASWRPTASLTSTTAAARVAWDVRPDGHVGAGSCRQPLQLLQATARRGAVFRFHARREWPCRSTESAPQRNSRQLDRNSSRKRRRSPDAATNSRGSGGNFPGFRSTRTTASRPRTAPGRSRTSSTGVPSCSSTTSCSARRTRPDARSAPRSRTPSTPTRSTSGPGT